MTVEVSNPAGTLSFRDRSAETPGQITHPLADLLEDFVFNNGGERLNLALGGLMPGSYTITTYFHDQHKAWGKVGLSVTDAAGAERGLVGGIQETTGNSPTTVGSATFTVFSNGVDPVTVHIDEETADHVMLNGFTATDQDSLRVDLAPGTSSDPDVQHGFLPFGSSGGTTQGFSSFMGIAGTVTVTIGAADGVVDWRDRGQMTVPLADLAEEFALDRTGLQLVLDDLQAGEYFITTYHHDRGYGWGPIDIDISDARGAGRPVATDFAMSTGVATDPACVSFFFTADGMNPVTIDFTTAGLSFDHEIALLNGFALSYIPEPTSLTLLAGGLLALARRRKRR